MSCEESRFAAIIEEWRQRRCYWAYRIIEQLELTSRQAKVRASTWSLPIFKYIDIYAYGCVMKSHFRQFEGFEAHVFDPSKTLQDIGGFRAWHRGPKSRQDISEVRARGYWEFCRLGCFGVFFCVVLKALFLYWFRAHTSKREKW